MYALFVHIIFIIVNILEHPRSNFLRVYSLIL